MRSSSPTPAIDIPAAIDRPLGCASTTVATPHTNPSATRLRASAPVRLARTRSGAGMNPPADPSDTAGFSRQTAVDGGDHFGRFDVEQAHARLRAPAEMMALADLIARHSDIV